METAFHTCLLSDNSKLNHTVGDGNSEVNTTRSLLSRSSQSIGLRQKSQAASPATSNDCIQNCDGSTEEGHVTQVRGIKKGFLEKVTSDMSLDG